MNPFTHCARSIHGPATDALPVTPDDATDLPIIVIALYIETEGSIVIHTVTGQSCTCTIEVADFSVLLPGTRRICSSGATTTGIHALVLV